METVWRRVRQLSGHASAPVGRQVSVGAVALSSGLALLFAGCGHAGSSAVVSPSTGVVTASSQVQFQAETADWNQRYVACARRYGADAQVGAQGTISRPVAPGRPTVDGGLDADCVKEVGSPPPAPPATPRFLGGLYVLTVAEAKCLRAHGYTISDPPPKKVWVDTYGAASWDPLSDVTNSGRDVVEAMHKCPQPDDVEAERVGNQQP